MTRLSHKFLVDVPSEDLLDLVIDWISKNVSPSDVFSDSVLKEWTSDVFNPEEIFSVEVLEKWATDNHFVIYDE